MRKLHRRALTGLSCDEGLDPKIWGSLNHTSGKSPDPIDMGEPGGGWGPQAGGFQFRAGFTRDLDFR